eukprot:Nk52_evm5s385 gene=Nk52_evmTU5s385
MIHQKNYPNPNTGRGRGGRDGDGAAFVIDQHSKFVRSLYDSKQLAQAASLDGAFGEFPFRANQVLKVLEGPGGEGEEGKEGSGSESGWLKVLSLANGKEGYVPDSWVETLGLDEALKEMERFEGKNGEESCFGLNGALFTISVGDKKLATNTDADLKSADDLSSSIPDMLKADDIREQFTPPPVPVRRRETRAGHIFDTMERSTIAAALEKKNPFSTSQETSTADLSARKPSAEEDSSSLTAETKSHVPPRVKPRTPRRQTQSSESIDVLTRQSPVRPERPAFAKRSGSVPCVSASLSDLFTTVDLRKQTSISEEAMGTRTTPFVTPRARPVAKKRSSGSYSSLEKIESSDSDCVRNNSLARSNSSQSSTSIASSIEKVGECLARRSTASSLGIAPPVPTPGTLVEGDDMLGVHETAPTEKAGILERKQLLDGAEKAKKRNWITVFAHLQNGFLHFYKDEKNELKKKAPISSFALDKFTICKAYDVHKSKHCAFLLSSKEATYLFNAKNETEKSEWVQCINDMASLEGVASEDSWDENAQVRMSMVMKTSSEVLDTSRSSFDIVESQYEVVETPEGKKGPPSRRGSKQQMKPSSSCGGSGDKQGAYRKLKAFFQRRPTPEDVKKKGIVVEAMFNLPLKDQTLTPFGIPLLVYSCVEYIERNDLLDSMGIYRLSGNASVIQKLALDFNAECSCGKSNQELHFLKNEEVNAVAGLLKRFFREQEDCLFTAEYYSTFIAMNDISDYDSRLIGLKNLLYTLPELNLKTLAYLMKHLKRISERKDVNKMGPNNIAIVFGPTLLHPPESSVQSLVVESPIQCRIVEEILIQCDWIFDGVEINA